MLILVVTYIVDWNSFIQVGLFCALCLVYLLFLRAAVSATCRALRSGSVCLSYYCVTSNVRANIKYMYIYISTALPGSSNVRMLSGRLTLPKVSCRAASVPGHSISQC